MAEDNDLRERIERLERDVRNLQRDQVHLVEVETLGLTVSAEFRSIRTILDSRFRMASSQSETLTVELRSLEDTQGVILSIIRDHAGQMAVLQQGVSASSELTNELQQRTARIENQLADIQQTLQRLLDRLNP